MAKVNLTETQKELIEKAGVVFEQDGLSPAAARTIGLLLVSDETELTFDAIYETLNMSKSAASNAINLLLATQKIEYITKPGDRKRYFRTRLVELESIFDDQMLGMLNNMVSIYKEILNQRTDKTQKFNNSLLDIIQFMELMQKEMPLIFQRWKASKKG